MSERKIQDAINSVEPQVGAKERMYQNIMKKAEQQTVPKKTPEKKKNKPIRFVRYALPIAACFCLLVIGAARFLPEKAPTASGESDVQIANPFVQVQSAEDFKAIGITLDAPAGAKNVEYVIIDNEIAQVLFEISGKNYTVRASAQSGDFSGLCGDEKEIKTIDAAQNAVLSAVTIDSLKYCKITWTNGKINYCLYGTDGADETQITAVYEAVIK